VDVALIFRHEPEAGHPGHGAHGGYGGHAAHAADAGHGPADEGLREQLLLDEPVNLILPAERQGPGEPGVAPAVTEIWPDDLAKFADHRWIAGCDRCREHLLQQCAAAGYTPKASFTTDDFVAVQALVAAGLGVALLPSLALRAAPNAGIRAVRLRGSRRRVLAVRYGEPPDPPATVLLMEALRAACAPTATASTAIPSPSPAPEAASEPEPERV
jgi:DNA-binding transcriptional LysR family regulator